MRKLIKPANLRKLFLLMLCCLLCQGGGLFAQQEREFYRQDFYLNESGSEKLENDSDEPDLHWLGDEEAEEEKPVQRDWYDDENQIVMSDDGFVVPLDGRKREDILFFYLLPGFVGLLTLFLIWVYFKVWLASKKEIHQTRQRLMQLRGEFRSRETNSEFHSRLKEVLKLPPGATSRDISRAMPVQDNELQKMIDKYDDNFRKPET